MSGDHERGDKKDHFCAVPAKPKCGDCPGSKDYIEVCKPEDWFGHTFLRLVKAQAGAYTFEKKYEAHHVLCVAPVTQQLVANTAIDGAIRQTAWCINNEKNMIAMPLWGHTVMWYCDISAVASGGGSIKSTLVPPPFANIPQHDWDHNSKEGYTWEVEEECKNVAKEVEESDHDLGGESLKGTLDKLSGKFKTTLKTDRGTRLGGTHAGWLQGMTDSQSNWCHPFSMASTAKLTKVGFPIRDFNTRSAQWIQRIANAIGSGV